MSKRCALIITDNKEFSTWEIFKFYSLKKDNADYYKYEIDNTEFYIINIPVPDKIKNKHLNYLAQYIKYLKEKLNAQAVYYKWSEKSVKILHNSFNNNESILSYASYYPTDVILKKYSSMCRVPLPLANVILICDFPIAAEKIIREICRDVRAVHIYTKNSDLYKPIIDYFLSEYGILLTSGETLEGIPKKNRLAVNLSDDVKLAENFIKKNEIEVLNISQKRLNIKNVYENMYFTACFEFEKAVSICGKFDTGTLFYMFNAMCKDKNIAEFMRFIHKFDIKIIKFVKND